MDFPKRFLLLVSLIHLPALNALQAEDGLPRQISLDGVPATLIEDVIVPHPAELFALMDKLPGRADWRSRVRQDFNVRSTNDRTTLALVFGMMIADGFIAVQAQDPDGVRSSGREILELAEALSLRDAVLPHARAILDACEKEDWKQVRIELDRVHKTVSDLMEQMRDDELARCVSVAGWIRGTHVLTSIITEAYSPDKAEILNQPDLAAHFVHQLQAMEKTRAESPSMELVFAGMREVESLMAQPGRKTIPSDSVRQIYEIVDGIVDKIAPDAGAQP